MAQDLPRLEGKDDEVVPRSVLAAALDRVLALEEENRRLAEALADSEKHGRVILDATAEAIFLVDAQGRCDFANPSALALLRVGSATEVIGHELHTLLSPSHPDGSPIALADCPIIHAIRAGRVARFDEVRSRRPDGEPFWAEILCSPIERGGEVTGAVVTVVDVSDRRRAQDEALHTAAFREQILGIVGHDLRNPLGAIVMSTALLQKRGGLTGWQAKTIDRMRSSAGRMSRIINDLLSYTRTRLGTGIPIERRPCDLADLSRKVMDELSAANPDREISLQVDGDVTGEWDPDRLEQVVSNLISNAIDHGDPAHPVVLELSGGPEAVTLSVKNAGDPIPPDVLAHAFEPFHRGPEEKCRKGSGLGLGLYIARIIVQGHGGEIAIRAPEGGGTQLEVSLPRQVAT